MIILIKVLVLVLFLFIPALIVNAVDVVKEEIEHITQQSKISEEIYETFLRKVHTLKQLKRKLLTWLKAELGTEIFYQVLIQLILLMMYNTDTPTQSGLDAMFAQDSSDKSIISPQVFLAFSIIWSLKTCITTHVKAAKVEKDFLPFTSSLVLYVQTTVGTVKRLGVMFFFFAPFFGHLNLLQHWKAELKPWKSRDYINFKEDMMFIGNVSMPWSSINRADYTNPSKPTPPGYTLYTGLDLGEAYLVFLLVLVLQVVSIFLCKLYTTEQFKRKSFLQKIMHSVENCSLVSPLLDWDTETGNVAAHRKKMQQVKEEMSAAMLMNFFWHAVMLVPILFTGTKVRARHQLLKMTIGTFPEEEETYNLVTILMIVLPIGLLLLSFLELGLFLLYNGKMHPWKAIFVQPEEVHFQTNETLSVKSDENSEILESEEEDIDAKAVTLGPVIDDTSVSDRSNTRETAVEKQVLITESKRVYQKELDLETPGVTENEGSSGNGPAVDEPEEIEECTKL